MDFDNLSYDELDQQMMQSVVFADEFRSSALQGHLFVESVIEFVCTKALVHPEVIFGDRVDFAAKLRLARALDTISEREYGAFKALNKLRNNYAHDLNFEPSIVDIDPMNFDLVDIQKKAIEAAKTRGSNELAQISVIFLCWKALNIAHRHSNALRDGEDQD